MNQINKVHDGIKEYILELKENSISKKRLKNLEKIINEINRYTIDKNYPKIIFICTHNSRRSQLAEIWAHTFNFVFEKNIKVFSAGTVKDKFSSRLVSVLKEIGFKVKKKSNKFIFNFSENHNSIPMNSKLIDEIYLKDNFITIMTCSNADKNCPVIPNALSRILLSYEDPKKFDFTNQETKKYKETSHKIALEFYYIFKNLK